TYWDNPLRRRVARRRLLQLMGGASLAAGAVACGASTTTPTAAPTTAAVASPAATAGAASPAASATPAAPVAKRGGTFRWANASFLAAVDKIEAVDKYTLKLTALKPAADFLVDIAAPQSVIVAKELVEQKGDLKQGPMIGTGPFIVEKVDPNGTSSAVRNPD